MAYHRPIVGISCGDPCGIGPEIIIKSLANDELYSLCKPLVIADARVMELALQFGGLSLSLHAVDAPEAGTYLPGRIDVIDIPNVEMDRFSFGTLSAMAGKASYDYVRKAIALAMNKSIDATVTGPINKEALHLAGLRYAGHTEIFSRYTNCSSHAMMLAEGSFRVVHVNTHVSMLEAIRNTTVDRVYATIVLAYKALKNIGIDNPRIAVNGLNPHAGENGLFGKEEIDHIIPAIQRAKEEGILADGPHPPDTIFPKMRGGLYDVVVCMYHDQGHIPTKLMGFHYDKKKKQWKHISGVNITLGLPIIRVSVDHGTAFDIAGKGVANPESMIQAIKYAVDMASYP